MKWYILNQIDKTKYYYKGYLEAVSDFHRLADKLQVYSCALIIGFEK